METEVRMFDWDYSNCIVPITIVMYPDNNFQGWLPEKFLLMPTDKQINSPSV